MTSTNFNVGLGGTAKNSSRVLKPPGGGTSDIFGPAEPAEQPRRMRQQPASNLFLGGNDNPTPSKPKPAGNPVTGDGYNDKPDGPASSPTPSQSAVNGNSAVTPGRQRVPPGGFSSGLW